MRIITGKLGGRQFDTPKGHKTHPMSEKMRGALFNVLGDVSGLTILDAYGGSGAIAFEALSRGASYAQIIDMDKAAVRAITKNIKDLSLSAVAKLTVANVSAWSDNNPNITYDLVIADPPYNDIKIGQLDKITRHIKAGGLYILSLPSDFGRPSFDGFSMELDRNYGDGSLVFYRKI